MKHPSKKSTSISVRKRMTSLGMSLGRIYLLLCAALYFLQGRFIFAPAKTIEETPADFGLTFSEVWLPIPTSNSKPDRIHGWWIPAQSRTAKTLLYFHGNGINIGANSEQASRFHKLGLSVFLFDYRGYGKSEGSFPNEKAVYADAQRAWDYLTQERKIAPQNIVIYGHSLGGAIAINLAQNHPNASGLIVQSSFSSALEMAQRNWWTAIFPTNLLLNQRFASLEKVPSLQMPTLYIHGLADQLIPFKMSQRLFDATRSPKQIKFFPKAGHNDVAKVGGMAYTQTVRTFLDQVDKTACKDCSETRQIRQSGSTSAPILR
jgi:uncharacterized protein